MSTFLDELTDAQSILLYSFFGVFLQEVWKLYNLRLKHGNDVKISRSLDYWVITIIYTIAFTFLTPELVKWMSELAIKEQFIESSGKLFIILVGYGSSGIFNNFSKTVLAMTGLKSITQKIDDDEDNLSPEDGKPIFKGMIKKGFSFKDYFRF